MADYFTNFSFIVPLPNEAAQQYAVALAEQALYSRQGDKPLPGDFPTSLCGALEDWVFETAANSPAEGWGLWLHSSSGGIDAACTFIQHLLQNFDPDGQVAFEWSQDCSKPRVNAYGGGAAVVTATTTRTINTRDWIRNQPADLGTTAAPPASLF